LVGAAPGARSSIGTDPRDLVVMVRVKHADGEQDYGAGILVSQSPKRTVIITADHVVRRGDDSPGAAQSEITVELNSLRDTRFRARLSTYSSRDAGLDLAVLLVEDQSVPKVLQGDLLNAVSPLPIGALTGRSAVIVGFIRGTPWEHSLTGEPIASATPVEILVDSNTVDHGASGGALFDAENRALLGMVISDANKRAVARPIGLLLQKLKQWNIEVSLTNSKNTAGGAKSRCLAEAENDFVRGCITAVNVTAATGYQDGGLTLVQVSLFNKMASRMFLMADARHNPCGMSLNDPLGQVYQRNTYVPCDLLQTDFSPTDPRIHDQIVRDGQPLDSVLTKKFQFMILSGYKRTDSWAFELALYVALPATGEASDKVESVSLVFPEIHK
jgi:hypothetical protein